MLRNPVVAGQFYPAATEKLRGLVQSLVDEHAERTALGAVCPHAGYIYSGAVAGAVISRLKPADCCIIMGPNHTGRGKPFSIMTSGQWRTPLGDAEIDSPLAERVLSASPFLAEDFAAHQYEHSIEVQLPFLQYFKPDIKIVPIIMATASDACRDIGRCIARAISESGRETTIIASSDMTHYEAQESARRKDSQAIEAILRLDETQLIKRVEELDISMCGFAPVLSLLAALKELGAVETELVRYQTSGDASGDYSRVVGYAGITIKKISAHPLVMLARNTVETYVREGRVIQPPEPSGEMKGRAGVFVSIYKHGALRGCIGTFESTRKTLVEEVIHNAVSSATRDPRFPPVSPDELKDLTYSVDVLTKPSLVTDRNELDPRRYGVIVECGFRRGLLLPDLEGVDTVEDQVKICCQKGGIGSNEPVKIYCFEVKRYK